MPFINCFEYQFIIMTSIVGLSSAFPKYKVFQDDVKALGRKIFSSKTFLSLGQERSIFA